VSAWSTPVLTDGVTRRLLAPALVALTLAMVLGRLVVPALVPVSMLLLPVLLGAWRLTRRELVVVSAVVLAALAAMIVDAPAARTVVAGVVVVAGIVLAFWYVGLRERWGFSAARGVQILLEVRDGLRGQGTLPQVAGWQFERTAMAAGDAALRGDFTLAAASGSTVQLVVVDVSGHGPGAAARALQLAGAFGGMLGEVPPATFAAAANRYCRRQAWTADYATLVHADLDVRTGILQVRSAGHPRVQVRRADGRWQLIPSSGPLLGLVETPTFHGAAVTLRPGELAVLLTDGVLAEHADELQASGALRAAVDAWLADGATTPWPALVAALPSPHDDDRTAVLVRRGDAS
jgi:hypothetical protein